MLTPPRSFDSGLAGQRVVITGGSSGIGLEVAKNIVALGGRVVVVGRDTERLRTAADAIGSNVDVSSTDVTQEDAVQRLFASLGTIDHLITAAGPMPSDAPLLKLRMSDARSLFEGKFWSQFVTVKYAVPKIRPGGSITMLGGSISRKAAAGAPVFASMDGAIESLARVLAVELAPIRVNVVAPGIIDTPMLSAMSPEMRKAVLERSAQGTMVKRHGQPEDVSRAIIYLLGNTFVSGTVLDVDGGKLGTFWSDR